ncbi:unnamed protein product, partial [Adineta steineri]
MKALLILSLFFFATITYGQSTTSGTPGTNLIPFGPAQGDA